MGKEDKKFLTILVIKDNDSKAMKAFSINQKGSGDGEIVKKIQKLIDDQWGRRKIIMKADKEAAIKAYQEQAAAWAFRCSKQHNILTRILQVMFPDRAVDRANRELLEAAVGGQEMPVGAKRNVKGGRVKRFFRN